MYISLPVYNSRVPIAFSYDVLCCVCDMWASGVGQPGVCVETAGWRHAPRATRQREGEGKGEMDGDGNGNDNDVVGVS